MCKTTGAVMKTPHKHAVVIKAWADGADIQVRMSGKYPWIDLENYPQHSYSDPQWWNDYEYRIKPEKKTPGQVFYEGFSTRWGEQPENFKRLCEEKAAAFLKAMKEQE